MPRQYHTLNFAEAAAMLRAGEDAAMSMGLPYCIAVVDAGGHLLAFSRQDGALIGSIALAIGKAYTSRLFDKATAEVQRMAQPGTDLYGIQQSNRGDVVIIGGGLPVIWNDQIIGAVGASAGSPEQDIAVASAALAALKLKT